MQKISNVFLKVRLGATLALSLGVIFSSIVYAQEFSEQRATQIVSECIAQSVSDHEVRDLNERFNQSVAQKEYNTTVEIYSMIEQLADQSIAPFLTNSSDVSQLRLRNAKSQHIQETYVASLDRHYSLSELHSFKECYVQNKLQLPDLIDSLYIERFRGMFPPYRGSDGIINGDQRFSVFIPLPLVNVRDIQLREQQKK